MGKVDLEQLKADKKAKKLAKKDLSGSKKPQSQKPPPTPLVRIFRPIPNPRPLAKTRLGTITIMSFNILAQCLVKRHLFPDSGDMLKWASHNDDTKEKYPKTRKNMVDAEISMYNPDIMCLQEVDQYETHYKLVLEKLGYVTEYYKHPKKLHGCLIAYKSDQFEKIADSTIDYDTDPLCPPTWITTNIGQAIALRHVQHPEFGLVIGNTHLYWRPEATYERLRQTAIYFERVMDLWKSLEGSATRWVPLLIGDFNTSPQDPGHDAVVKVSMSEADVVDLEKSRATPGSFKVEGIEAKDVQGSGEDKPIEKRDETLPTPHVVAVIKKYSPSWRSVYSYHGEIDSETSDPSGEPKFTNYTAAFKNTLDYMYISEKEDAITPIEILMCPREEALKPSLPNQNFGSDHMCLVAKFDYGV
ncbi:Endonuclease/exonuclease/phosphatase [Dichotomocladium elegans]|nr:Endonuclease/exonuclease/phosphatase [Dichotomocladium elegans]